MISMRTGPVAEISVVYMTASVLLCLYSSFLHGGVLVSPRRPSRSLCQGCCGWFRTMPLYRHCEEHAWPQVEPTLWSVSLLKHFYITLTESFLTSVSEGFKCPPWFMWISLTYPQTQSDYKQQFEAMPGLLECLTISVFFFFFKNPDVWDFAVNKIETDENSSCIWIPTYLNTP